MKKFNLILVFLLIIPIVCAIPDWDVTGAYTLDFTCTGGCGGDYIHTMQISVVDLGNGDFSGNGFYNVDPAYTWDVTGNVDQSNMLFQIVYTGLNPGYTVNAIGAIAGDGTFSGNATAPGQTFTWRTTSGAATPYTQPIPEFTTIGAAIVLIGSGLYARFKRRK